MRCPLRPSALQDPAFAGHIRHRPAEKSGQACGGGGAGHEDDTANGGAGGAGGGVVWLRLGSLSSPGSTGAISANGVDGSVATDDGAGGGGAGGTVIVRAFGNVVCSSLTVLGGDGGNSDSGFGPGGGGSGGRVWLARQGGLCPVDTGRGSAGTSTYWG